MLKQSVVSLPTKTNSPVHWTFVAGQILQNILLRYYLRETDLGSEWGFCGTTEGFCNENCQNKGGCKPVR